MMQETRDICKKLLSDDIWRNEIVQASKKFIDKNCRWHHRFKKMEEAINVPILRKKDNNIETVKTKTIYLRKKEYTLFGYGFIGFIVTNIVFIYSKKMLHEIYFFLNRKWRNVFE